MRWPARLEGTKLARDQVMRAVYGHSVRCLRCLRGQSQQASCQTLDAAFRNLSLDNRLSEFCRTVPIRSSVLFCAVPCLALLCFALPCCAVPCCALLWWAVLCCAELNYPSLCRASDATPCLVCSLFVSLGVRVYVYLYVPTPSLCLGLHVRIACELRELLAAPGIFNKHRYKISLSLSIYIYMHT